MKLLSSNLEVRRTLRGGVRTLGSGMALGLLGALALSVGAIGCSDDGNGGDFAAVEDVLLISDPESVTFDSVAIDETSTKTITIFNQSNATARINFNLVEQPTPNDQKREFDWDNAQRDMLSKTVTLEGNTSLTLLVNYTPRDEYRDTGSVVLDYNGGTLTIPLATLDISPDIDGPSRLIFGRVPSGGTVSKSMQIQNVGRAPLTLRDMYLGNDSDEFDFCFPQDAEGDDEAPCLAVDEPGAWPEVLNYLETVEVRVIYSPTNDGEDSTTFLVESDDPDEQPFSIEINANGAEPCILVSDEGGVDFGTGFIGGVSQRTMTITNCSPNKELEVSGIKMVEGSDEEFFVDTLPGELPDNAVVVEPGENTSFVLSYAPTAEAANEGTLEIRSNDRAKDPLLIPVNGRGSNNACPTAVAKGRIQGQGGPAVSQIETIPLATVQFDGTQSSDPDNPGPGGIAAYEWSIVERPADSTATFSPNSTVANPSLFIDLAGRYKVQLRVYDQQNVPSCEISEVVILATPNEDIHIQLVWDTDGTDVDLHFLHPNGRWNASPYDCHWLNREPNWGSLNANNDNPSLDIDDVDGFGPENINLDNPESVNYRVGVHYYSDHFLGASNITVRIWVSSVLAFEFRNKFMTDGQFWDTATVDWGPSPQVNQIDAMFPDFP